MLRLTHREANEMLRWVILPMGIDEEQLGTIRPFLTQVWQLSGDDNLRFLHDALLTLRASWAEPLRTVDYPLWCYERGRKLSGWEEVHLRVSDYAKARTAADWGALDAAFPHERGALRKIAYVAVCGFGALARDLAKLALEQAEIWDHQRIWVAWIAGRELAPSDFDEAEDGEPPSAWHAALQAQWDDVLTRSSNKALKAGKRAVTSSEKLLVQLARYKLGRDSAPTERVLRASFGRWFAYSYHANTPYNLDDKIPFAYLFGREIQSAPAEELVARIGQSLGHLQKPPAPTFYIPERTRELLELFIAFVAEAIERGLWLTSHRTSDHVELLLGDEVGTHDPHSWGDLL